MAKSPAKKPAPAKKAKSATSAAKPAKPPQAAESKASKAVVPAKPVKKDRPDLHGKILHLISEEMAIEEAELTPAASFKEDLGLDEIDVAELLMQAEQAFGVAGFGDKEWESCETVQDFIQLVQDRTPARRGAKNSSADA